MAKKVLVILSEGFEEIEAIVPIDLLRRAKLDVTIATPDPQLVVTGRCNIQVVAQKYLKDVAGEEFDALVIPGGPAAQNLKKQPEVLELVRNLYKKGKNIAAICAAPLVLKNSGVLEGHRYTSHPTTIKELTASEQDQPVVVDKQLITSQAPGTAMAFALNVLAELIGKKAADNLREDIRFQYEY